MSKGPEVEGSWCSRAEGQKLNLKNDSRAKSCNTCEIF